MSYWISKNGEAKEVSEKQISKMIEAGKYAGLLAQHQGQWLPFEEVFSKRIEQLNQKRAEAAAEAEAREAENERQRRWQQEDQARQKAEQARLKEEQAKARAEQLAAARENLGQAASNAQETLNQASGNVAASARKTHSKLRQKLGNSGVNTLVFQLIFGLLAVPFAVIGALTLLMLLNSILMDPDTVFQQELQYGEWHSGLILGSLFLIFMAIVTAASRILLLLSRITDQLTVLLEEGEN